MENIDEKNAEILAQRKADDLINRMIQYQPTFVDMLSKMSIGAGATSVGFVPNFCSLRKALTKEFLDK
jgi:hypothetical protein